MKEILINRVMISNEAKFDYSYLVKGGCLTSRTFCNEFDEYIDNLSAKGRLSNTCYLRLKFYDERVNDYMIFFVKRRNRFRCIQNWEVIGICNYGDWSEEMENNGSINRWLRSKIYDLPKEPDWVEEMRNRDNDWKELMEEMYGIQL